MSNKKQKAAFLIKDAWGQIFNKLTLHYFLFGFAAVIIKFLCFLLFFDVLSIKEEIANALAWIISMLFSYITYRKYVFKSKTHGKKVFAESAEFIISRLLCFFLEAVMLELFLYLLKMESHIAEISVTTIAALINYFVTRIIVFKKKRV